MVALARRKEHRNLVRFVERWGEVGTPSESARMAQARALVELRLLDRATIRLKELANLERSRTEALKLLGRCYILRGWPAQAHGPLEEAAVRAPDDPEIQALRVAAAEPPVEPRDPPDDEADPERLCAAAESFLAAGAFLKAQRLLERSRRARPNNPRAIDLLWALGGDYSATEPLDELVRRWGPDMNLPEVADEAEHTESVTMSGLPVPDLDPHDPLDQHAFPALFRSITPAPASGEDADHTEDLTQSSSIADLRSHFDNANPDAPTSLEDADDTQIVRVVHNDLGAEDTGVIEGVIQRAGARAAAVAAPGPLTDLTQPGERRATAPGPSSDLDLGLEAEDDDLIILTGRPEDLPREVAEFPPLDPDPTTSDVEGRVVDILELVRAEQRAAPSPAPAPAVSLPPVDASKDRAKRKRRVQASGAGLWLIAIGGVLGLAGVSVLGLALLKLLVG